MDKKIVREIARDIQSPEELVRTQAITMLDGLGRDAVPWLVSFYLNDRYGGGRRIPYTIAVPCYNALDIVLGLLTIAVVVAPKRKRAILSYLHRWGDRVKRARLSMLPKITSVERGILLAALRYDDLTILNILGDALWCTKGSLRDACEQKVIELLLQTDKEEFKSLFARNRFYDFLDYPYIERNTELIVALIEFFTRIQDINAEMFIRSLANDHIVVDVPMSASSRQRVVAAAKSAVARWNWPSLESPFPRAKPKPGASAKK